METQRDSQVNRREFLKTAGAGTALAGVASVLPAETGDQQDIPQRMLGKTGVRVPILGLGTGPVGKRTPKEATALFHEALDRGVTYLDTAPQRSGYGVSQVALGEVLKTRRKEAFVVTKSFFPDGETALAMLKQNLKELQTDYADVVYAHSLGADEMEIKKVMGPNGSMKALEKARRDGLVRFIGISGHNRTSRFLELIREFNIQVMMNAVNFVARHIYDFETKVWPEAHDRGIALVAMKIFGGRAHRGQEPKGGRLTGEDAALSFRYAQGLPNVSTVVVGASDSGELTQNIEWARNYKPFAEEELQTLLARGKKMAAEWGEVFGPVV
jgi:hypothetical protein